MSQVTDIETKNKTLLILNQQMVGSFHFSHCVHFGPIK